MKQSDFLLIVATSTLLIFAWIVFSIYHESVTSTIPESLHIQIAPINPTFDTKTLETLQRREIVTPLYESPATTSATAPIPSPSPTIFPTPTISINIPVP